MPTSQIMILTTLYKGLNWILTKYAEKKHVYLFSGSTPWSHVQYVAYLACVLPVMPEPTDIQSNIHLTNLQEHWYWKK